VSTLIYRCTSEIGGGTFEAMTCDVVKSDLVFGSNRRLRSCSRALRYRWCDRREHLRRDGLREGLGARNVRLELAVSEDAWDESVHTDIECESP
jgi:hypothetical protein